MFTKTSNQSTERKAISLVKQGQANLRHIGIMAGGMLLGLSINLLAGQEAKAASFNFTRIAESSGSFDVFGGFSLNNQGIVAFKASLDGGGEGIFTGNGMNVTPIAQSNNYFERFPSTPDINDSGTVAFDSILNTQITGIFTGNGSTITPIDIGNNGIPIYYAVKGVSAPSINNAGTVAYVVNAYRSAGIATSNGGGVGGGSFSSYYAPYINDQGVIAYGVAGLYGAAITTSNNSVGISYGNYPITLAGSLTDFSINKAGTLAFIGFNTVQNKVGVYKKNGTVITTSVEGASNISYSNPSINNNNSVAFLASLAEGTAGIFMGADLLNDRVISTGDSLLGSTVTELGFSRKGFNDAGQVAFFAKFTDGSSGIFRADPVSPSQSVPEPSSGLAVLMFGTLGAGSVLRCKRKSVSKVASDV